MLPPKPDPKLPKDGRPVGWEVRLPPRPVPVGLVVVAAADDVIGFRGGLEGVGEDTAVPCGIGGSDSNNDAPKDEVGLKGLMALPPIPVV